MARQAQNPNPGPKDARIANVLKPESGHYVVIVRMTSHMLKDYPDEPWLTDISEIGLPTKDSSKYVGYKLVDIQRIDGTEDHYWLFQKFPGPLWYTHMRGTTSVIPAKFKRFIESIESRQEVVPSTDPDVPAGDLIMSVVQDNDNTGKSLKTNLEEILVIGPPLEGAQTGTWGTEDTLESLVAEGTAIEEGFGIKQSVTDPLGDGKAIKNTVEYPAALVSNNLIWTLEGQEQDPVLEVVVDIEKSLVNPANAKAQAAAKRALGWFTEIQPLDKYHSIMISAKVLGLPPDQEWDETGGLNLPDVLEEIGIIWDADGTADSSTGDALDDATIIAEDLQWEVAAEVMVSGSISGRVYTKMRGGKRGNTRVSVVRSFHYGPPPGGQTFGEYVFEPVYATITMTGKQAQQHAKSVFAGKGGTKLFSHQSGRSNNDSRLIITQAGPFEVVAGTELVHRGTPSFARSASASGGGCPSGGLYPFVQVDMDLQATYSFDMPDSGTEPLQSGDSYVAKVLIYPWRYGIWIKEVYTVHVP
jgi:hypothetical protein